MLKALIRRHAEATHSAFAERLLIDWQLEAGSFWQIVPKEILNKLPQPLSAEPAELRA
ncbi:MAG: hypothetical protein H5U25_08200 [Oceanibaculum nanhaiense]|nr:hypothetical protein [Oceanibaculum nanhaiense]